MASRKTLWRSMIRADARCFLFLTFASLIGCAKPQTATTSPSSAAAASPVATSGPRIILPDRSAVSVEIASDPETRTQGLMFRDRLPEDVGMIFLVPTADEYPFWMKNTLIPLDMVWIDEAHRIVHITHDVPPCKADPCPDYPPHAKAGSVLELATGVAARHHLKDGDLLLFEGLDRAVVK